MGDEEKLRFPAPHLFSRSSFLITLYVRLSPSSRPCWVFSAMTNTFVLLVSSVMFFIAKTPPAYKIQMKQGRISALSGFCCFVPSEERCLQSYVKKNYNNSPIAN